MFRIQVSQKKDVENPSRREGKKTNENGFDDTDSFTMQQVNGLGVPAAFPNNNRMGMTNPSNMGMTNPSRMGMTNPSRMGMTNQTDLRGEEFRVKYTPIEDSKIFDFDIGKSV